MIQPGDLLVYPWKDKKPGHMAIVVSGLHPNFREYNFWEKAAARALPWIGTGKYRLGKGGWGKFKRDTPLTPSGECDCSGFAYSWCFERQRHEVSPGIDVWWNTSAIYTDATGKQRRFEKVELEEGEDLAKVIVVHCHGPTATKANPKPPPAISKAYGTLWKKKNGIVVRVKNV